MLGAKRETVRERDIEIFKGKWSYSLYIYLLYVFILFLIHGVGRSLGSNVRGSGGPCSCYSFFYMNVSGIHLRSCLSSQPLVILAPWVPHQVVNLPGLIIPSWVTAFCFLMVYREAKLKPTTFSSLLLFSVFMSFIFL